MLTALSKIMWQLVPVLGLIVRISLKVAGDEGVLLERFSANSSWNWLTRLEIGKGSGWSRDSVAGSYIVCDMETTAVERTNSWLVSEFFSVQDAREIQIKLEFMIRQCPQGHPFCVEYFNLHAYHIDEPKAKGIDKDVIQNGSFTLIGPVNATRVWLPGLPPQSSVVDLRLVVKRKGVYLGFQDVGACAALNKVTITFKFCERDLASGVFFERTAAPSTLNERISIIGVCTNHSSPLSSNKLLTRECLSSGDWKTNDSVGCFCKPGYELAGEYCEACLDGFYKSSVSNMECFPCPANSKTSLERDSCPCETGFFRAVNDAPEGNCTGPPSSPTNLNIKTITKTVVMITWSPPLESGGRNDVSYDILCSMCFKNRRCTSGCAGLRFWPSNQGLNGSQVTISNITSSGHYNITVVSRNGVSVQAGQAAALETSNVVFFVDLPTVAPTSGEVVNVYNTESSNVAMTIGVSVAGTFGVCFIFAALVVMCLVKGLKNNTASLNETKRCDSNHTNGSIRSIATVNTDVSHYRKGLSDEEPIKLSTLRKGDTGIKSTLNPSNELSCRNSPPKQSSPWSPPRSVSPLLMKPWQGPPRSWNGQSLASMSSMESIHKNGSLSQERSASTNSWFPSQKVQYDI